MTYHFCTLFDKNFLARGLALYDSLEKQCSNFTLWILCMDEKSYQMIQELDLDKIKPLRLSEVEDDDLRTVKSTRTPVEYCWMFSSSLPLYILENNPDIDMIAYLDADLYFYAPLEEIYREFGDNSIMIIPHRFSKKNILQEKTSGIYNVGMMIFRNDKNSFECLRWWKDRVVEWCFNRYENGKLGDQLYLNDWTTRFHSVCVLENHGADVSSWNLDRYIFRQQGDSWIGIERDSGEEFPLIFYHFHGLNIYLDSNDRIKMYPISVWQNDIFRSYNLALNQAYKKIRDIDPSWIYGSSPKLDFFRIIKQYVQCLLRK